MLLAFGWSAGPAGADGKGLEPATCTWVDRPHSATEPPAVEFETSANAQLKQTLHGSQVDRSPTAAVNYPDAHTIPAYLTNPNHYWSFFVRKDPMDGRYVAAYHRHWMRSLRDRILVSPTGDTVVGGKAKTLPLAGPLSTREQSPDSGKTSGALTTPGQGPTEVTRPFIQRLQVNPRAGLAHISFATMEPAKALIEISTDKPLADVPAVTPPGQKLMDAFPPGYKLVSFAVLNDEVKERRVRMNRLEPDTTYNYVITAATRDGSKYRHWGKFKTLNRTVKVVFESVRMTSMRHGNLRFSFSANGEWLSDGNGGVLTRSYFGDPASAPTIGFKTSTGLYGGNPGGPPPPGALRVETMVQPAPGSLQLVVLGLDRREQLAAGTTGGDPRPYGKDSGSENGMQWSSASADIDTSANDSDQPGAYPFSFRTNQQGGNLVFEVKGRLEVSYSDQPSAKPRGPVTTKVGDTIKSGGTTLIRP